MPSTAAIPAEDNVPVENESPVPIVTLLNPPDPLPYKIEVPLVAGALLLNVVQSVDVKYPFTDPVAAAMLIAGVAPPLETTGAVPVTLVTVPDPLLLNVFQSVELKYPFVLVVAWLILIAGVAPPDDTTGAVPVTLVTVPVVGVVHVGAPAPLDVNT